MGFNYESLLFTTTGHCQFFFDQDAEVGSDTMNKFEELNKIMAIEFCRALLLLFTIQ